MPCGFCGSRVPCSCPKDNTVCCYAGSGCAEQPVWRVLWRDGDRRVFVCDDHRERKVEAVRSICDEFGWSWGVYPVFT